jgi:hypothetical protein
MKRENLDMVLGEQVRLTFFSPWYGSGGREGIISPAALFNYDEDRGYFVRFQNSKVYIPEEAIGTIKTMGNMIWLHLSTGDFNVRNLMRKIKEGIVK